MLDNDRVMVNMLPLSLYCPKISNSGLFSEIYTFSQLEVHILAADDHLKYLNRRIHSTKHINGL